MTHLETQLLEKLRTLPLEKQHEVLDFVEFLMARVNTPSSTQAFTHDSRSPSEKVDKPSFRDLFGIVKNSPNFSQNPVVEQETMHYDRQFAVLKIDELRLRLLTTYGDFPDSVDLICEDRDR